MTRRMVGVNEKGIRVGEDHQRAKLTDAEVDQMRRMHEVDKIGYRRLAAIFEVGKTTVRDICNYKLRCQAPIKFRPA